MLHKNKNPEKPRSRKTGRWEGAGAPRRQLMGLFDQDLSHRQRRWLAAFFVTGELRETARVAELPLTNHYNWMKANPAYSRAFEWARECVADNAEDSLHARGFNGFDKPVIYKGKITQWYKEYSDTCAVTWLKANRPTKYRDSLVNLTSNAPALINITLGAIADKPIQPAIDGPDSGDRPLEVNPN